MANISVQIQNLLANRAIVSYDAIKNNIVIKPPPVNKFCTGYFLEYIRDKGWNDIIIDHDIQVELNGWLIDTEDNNFGSDLWCLQWMKDNYNIVNKCDMW